MDRCNPFFWLHHHVQQVRLHIIKFNSTFGQTYFPNSDLTIRAQIYFNAVIVYLLGLFYSSWGSFIVSNAFCSTDFCSILFWSNTSLCNSGGMGSSSLCFLFFWWLWRWSDLPNLLLQFGKLQTHGRSFIGRKKMWLKSKQVEND